MRSTDRGGARFQRELPSPVAPHPADDLLTPERAAKYRQVLARRWQRVAVIIEDCHDPHNATAVMRTCDAFGIMRVHVVATRNAFKVNRRISQGSHRYLDVRVHHHIDEAYSSCRADGYRILASDLAQEPVLGLDAVCAERDRQPVALVFGSEATGISPEAAAGADACFRIPMLGFTESLNLSVSVAVTLYALQQEALLADAPGDLPAATQADWYDRWLRTHKGAAVDRLLRRMAGTDGEDYDVVEP